VFEQVGGLSVDFKRVGAGEQIKVEHPGLFVSVLHTNTNGYKRGITEWISWRGSTPASPQFGWPG
jgi:hypothetical protein